APRRERECTERSACVRTVQARERMSGERLPGVSVRVMCGCRGCRYGRCADAGASGTESAGTEVVPGRKPGEVHHRSGQRTALTMPESRHWSHNHHMYHSGNEGLDLVTS